MTLREFQSWIRRSYFARDSQRGVWSTYGWLTEEMGELAGALRRGERDAVALEMADVLAWVATLANLLELDLEEACAQYAEGCPKCGQASCQCAFDRQGD